MGKHVNLYDWTPDKGEILTIYFPFCLSLTMERIKTTFRRSKTPTAADLKIQSSLEIPKQLRSVSVDESHLKSFSDKNEGRSDKGVQYGSFLTVPSLDKPKSKSIEGDDFLNVPKIPLLSRRSSSERSFDGSVYSCIHCQLMEELERFSFNTSDEYEMIEILSDEYDEEKCPTAPEIQHQESLSLPQFPQRPRKIQQIGSPKLERQYATFSLENETPSETDISYTSSTDASSSPFTSSGSYTQLPCSSPQQLTVPIRDRSASCDETKGSFANVGDSYRFTLSVPTSEPRSKSLDIVFQNEKQESKSHRITSPVFTKDR